MSKREELVKDGSIVLQMSEEIISTAGGKSIGKLLSKIEELEFALGKIKSAALVRAERLLNKYPESVDGWKLGRSIPQRKITDERGLQDLLRSLIQSEDGSGNIDGMLTEEEIAVCSRLSLTKVEKLLKSKIHLKGKDSAAFIKELIKPYVKKEDGKKKLVKVSTYTEIENE